MIVNLMNSKLLSSKDTLLHKWQMNEDLLPSTHHLLFQLIHLVEENPKLRRSQLVETDPLSKFSGETKKLKRTQH